MLIIEKSMISALTTFLKHEIPFHEQYLAIGEEFCFYSVFPYLVSLIISRHFSIIDMEIFLFNKRNPTSVLSKVPFSKYQRKKE